MKLEIKHLAPYLPYGLNVGMPRLGKIESYPMYGLKYSSYAQEWVAYIDDKKHGDYQTSYIKGIQPILRPLSDLTIEIEHNGERFVPIVELLKIEHEQWYNKNLDTIYSKIVYDRTGTKAKAFFELMATKDITLYYLMPYNFPIWICDKLFEWHFDVFGLIDAGLAIDINTLNN